VSTAVTGCRCAPRIDSTRCDSSVDEEGGSREDFKGRPCHQGYENFFSIADGDKGVRKNERRSRGMAGAIKGHREASKSKCETNKPGLVAAGASGHMKIILNAHVRVTVFIPLN